MSKRNISYVKPQDPSFLARLKVEIGYKEGPTVETKKQKFQEEEEEEASGSDVVERPVREDEKPQIVVLQSGDLNADEVAQEEARIAREEAETPADLTQRIIFKKTTKNSTETSSVSAENSNKTTGSKKQKEQKGNQKAKSNIKLKEYSKLSFNNEEDEDQHSDSN